MVLLEFGLLLLGLIFFVGGVKVYLDILALKRAHRLEMAIMRYIFTTPQHRTTAEWSQLMKEADELDKKLLRFTRYGVRQFAENMSHWQVPRDLRGIEME